MAMINNKVETDSSAGDVTDLIKSLVEKEISDFLAGEVRWCWLVS